MIEVYINSDTETFRLPVVPSSFGENVGNDMSTEKIVKKGGVNVFNGYMPGTFTFDSFFPGVGNRGYYIDVEDLDPYECVGRIKKWIKEGERLRFIVTETSINTPVRISSFEYEEKDGTGDVYYTISLKEDEDIKIDSPIIDILSKAKLRAGANSAVMNKPRKGVNKVVMNSKRVIHTVKKGEYLFLIAQKYYGDGKKYTKIKNNAENQKNYPKLKSSNYIYVGWKLVIP